MANEYKGEVGFTSKGAEYKLSFSANALCELEDVLKKDAGEIERMFVNPVGVRLSDLRIVFWQGLCDHHEGITLEQTKDILKGLSPGKMGELIGLAFLASMKDDGAAGDAPADPPKPDSPAGGTGPDSLQPGSSSDS